MGQPHSRKRGTCRQFRRVVPADLRARLGRREIVRSLGSIGPGEARVIVNRLWTATETLFMTLRLNPGVSKEEVAAFCGRLLDDLRFDTERELGRLKVEGDPAESFPLVFTAEAYELDAESGRAALARNELAVGRRLLDTYFGDAVVELEEDDVVMLARAAMRVRSQADDEAAARIRKEVLPHLAPVAAFGSDLPRATAAVATTDKATPAAGAVGLRNAAMPFSELWPKYVADRILIGSWSAPIARQNEASRKLFLMVCGDKPMGGYGTLDAAEFRTMVLGLPRYYDRAAAYSAMYRDGDLAGIVAAAKAADAPTLQSKTYNRHYSALNPMWAFAVTHEALPEGAKSIFDKNFIKQPKKKDGGIQEFEKRPMWPDVWLKTILAAPLFHGCYSRVFSRIPGPCVYRDERYWGILLGFHTGMRREEIFQLEVRHVRCDEETGIWHFDLFTRGLRLKDTGSPRYVPLHPNLHKLGFIDERVVGRSPNERLFPEAKASMSDGKYGDLFGKWFGRWRKLLGVPEDMDFHSFRHTVATLLVRSGCSIPFAEEFIGHESAGRRSEFARYNKGQTLRILQDAIDKVILPIDVDAFIAAAQRGKPDDRGG